MASPEVGSKMFDLRKGFLANEPSCEDEGLRLQSYESKKEVEDLTNFSNDEIIFKGYQNAFDL